MLLTDHHGHEIRFDESKDEWECRALELTDKILSRLKQAINKIEAEDRRVDMKPVIVIGWSGRESGKAALIDADGKHVWVVFKDRGKTRREKKKISGLILDTPENVAKLDEADVLSREASVISDRRQDIIASIPKVTPADLQPES